jgi:hypothetical protein
LGASGKIGQNARRYTTVICAGWRSTSGLYLDHESLVRVGVLATGDPDDTQVADASGLQDQSHSVAAVGVRDDAGPIDLSVVAVPIGLDFDRMPRSIRATERQSPANHERLTGGWGRITDAHSDLRGAVNMGRIGRYQPWAEE